MSDAQAQKQILISARDTYALGDSILIGVRYVNQGQVPLSFNDPQHTWEVSLRIERAENETSEVPLGQLEFYEQGDLQRTTVEEAELVTLSPGENHAFHVDASARWMEEFAPGRYRLSIVDRTDDELTLNSNVVEFAVVYTTNSFPLLLNVVADGSRPLAARQFARDWIAHLYGEFLIQLQVDSEAQIQQNIALVQRAQDWWILNQASPEVAGKLAAVNPVGQ